MNYFTALVDSTTKPFQKNVIGPLKVLCKTKNPPNPCLAVGLASFLRGLLSKSP